jgi:hypothetical protein
VLTRRNDDPEIRDAHIIPTDTLSIPEQDEVRPMQDLMADAFATGPTWRRRGCRWRIRRSASPGSRSATLPEVDLVGHAEQRPRRHHQPYLPNGLPDSAEDMAARSNRFWRAITPLTASACRSRCPFTTAWPKPTWRATKSR